MQFFQDAKLKAGVWLRERKERAEERKAANVEPPGVTVPAWLVRATKFASWVATIALIYFLWLYTLDVARDRAEAMHLTHIGAWVGDIQFWFPHIFGFAAVAFGIPYVAKIAIPTFVSLSWQTDRTAKVWSLLIAIAVSLVVISGTFAVQGHTIMERDRDAAVAVEQAQTGRAVLEARITAREAELRSMMENRNAYLAQAASVGAAEWQRSYIDQTAASDPQRERIVRALGAARAADAVRADIQALREQAAAAPAIAGVQREVVTERTGWISATLGWLEGVRAILLSFVMDIVALIMPLIALRLEQARNRQLGMVDGIPLHPWMLEKPRVGEQSVSPDAVARRSAQDVVDAMIAEGADPRWAADMARSAARSGAVHSTLKDADTDQIIIDKDGDMARVVREHTRKVKGKDGKPIKMAMPTTELPDETGVEYDGGGRTGSTESDQHAETEANEAGNDDAGDKTGPEPVVEEVIHPELPEEPLPDMSDEDKMLLLESAAEEVDSALSDDPEAAEERDQQHEQEEPAHHERTEPETDKSRLIAAE